MKHIKKHRGPRLRSRRNWRPYMLEAAMSSGTVMCFRPAKRSELRALCYTTMIDKDAP